MYRTGTLLHTRERLKVFFKDNSFGMKQQYTYYLIYILVNIILKYSLQRKRKWNVASVSRMHLQIGSTVSLKPCLNLWSFKWLKFNLRHISNLIPLVSCIAKTELSLGLRKLRSISLNLFTVSAHHFSIEHEWKDELKALFLPERVLITWFDLLTSFGTLHHYID